LPLPVLLGVFPPNPFVSGLVTSHKKPISDSSPAMGVFALGVLLQSLFSRVRLIAVEASTEIGKQAVRTGSTSATTCGSVVFGKVLRESPGRDVINTVVRALEVGQQMKNIVTQILIATVAGVLSSIIWAGLQAPVTAPDGPGLLRGQILVCQNEKTALAS